MAQKFDTPLLILLSKSQHAALKEAAKAEGRSMADVLRDALEVWLTRIGPEQPATEPQA